TIGFDKAVAACTKAKTLRLLKKGASVYVRISDARRDGEYVFSKTNYNPVYMTEGKGGYEVSASPPFTKIIPKGVSEEDYQTKSLKMFMETLKAARKA
ncbi:hypothetical protein HDV05_008493, partial [Chytridiales sp. JEL 0842]